MYTFGKSKTLKIPFTLGIISDCWDNAEIELQKEINNYYPSADEEFITQTFHGMFAKQLTTASKNQLIKTAFLKDLRVAFSALQYGNELKEISNGLIADVTLHNRKTEKVTGGDIGLVIVRPKITEVINILKVGDYKRGLLCQAKLKGTSGKWGSFTKNQIRVLANRLGYLGLLLYSYKDKERRKLHQFSWQLCNSSLTIQEIAEWLKHDSFPTLVNSSKIIIGIGNGEIGTDDNKTLNDIIAPVENRVLEIRIGWPKDTPPPSEVRICSKSFKEQHIRPRVHIRMKN